MMTKSAVAHRHWLPCSLFSALMTRVLMLALVGLPPLAMAVAESPGEPVEIIGTLEVVQVCYISQHQSERWYDLIEDKTGQRHRLKFEVEPQDGHLTGERVRLRGQRHGDEIRVSAAPDQVQAGMEVLAQAPPQTNGLAQTVNPKVLYGGGTTANTTVHKTLVELLLYSDYAASYYTAASVLSFSNEFFAATGNSVNTDYLEDTHGAVGFAGNVVICRIADTSGDYNTGTWMSQGDAAAAAQGYNVGSYAHKVYICSGAGGWAGLAAVGGNWSMDYYTDGGTICHELGHNLGFYHASAQWNNTSGWDEYGDSSDFMGGSYDWRHNNGPHKVQMGWEKAQTLSSAGTYQISRLEDVPSTVPYPQVLTVPASSPPNGWPYYFSYKQPVGFDVNAGYNTGLNIHRWAGGNTAAIAVLADGQVFTDSAAGLTVKQLSHNATSVTVQMILCNGVAQPYTLTLTSEQLAARTPALADVVGGIVCDPLTITNFDLTSAKGGTVTLTNNQLFYTPPGVFSGYDSFNYTVVDLLGAQSSSTVTIVPITQPHFNWDANGASAGTGGAGTWDTASYAWDNGTNRWPGSGTSNWALFGGTVGTVSIAAGGVAANGLDFKTDGYLLQNNTLTLNGSSPVILVEQSVGATLRSVVAGAAGLIKAGQGTLTLSNANTFSGGALVSAGTIKAAYVSAFGSGAITLGDTNTGSSSVAVLFGGLGSGAGPANAIRLATNGTGTATLGSYAGPYQQWSSALTLNRPVTFGDGTGDRTSLLGVISGTPTAITISRGRVTFANSANSFTGNLNILAGCTFQTDAATVLPATTSIQADGTFQLNNGGAQAFDALNGGGTVTIIAGGAATMTVGSRGGSGVFSGAINNGANTLSLVKTGAGSQALSGGGSYTGGTTLRQGTLVLGNAAAAGTGPITVGDAATGANSIQLTLNADAIANPITVTSLGSGAVTLYATAQYKANTGTITLNRPTTLSVYNSSGGDWWYSFNNLAGNVGTLTLKGASGGANRVVLGSTNTFVGDVVVQQGRVQLNVPGTLATNNFTVNAGTDVRVWGGDQVLNSLNGAGGIYSDNGTTRNLLIGARNGTGVFSGSLSQNLSVTKTGSGTQTLSGANTYTGPTTVSNGTLLVNGSLASASAVTVKTNGTLGGRGAIGGAVTVQSGGTLAPGAGGIGTLTLSNSPSLGGRVLLEIQKGAVPNADKLAVIPALTYNGTLTVTNIGANPLAAGDTFTLFSASSLRGNFTATNLPVLAPGLGWAWVPTSGTLSVVTRVSTTPPNLAFGQGTSGLELSWPADHTGWRLQAQTNTLAPGLGTNWVDVPGSTSTNQLSLPLDSANPSVFYRLVFP